MLILLQLRLCGLSAMAPALTEAASQAQNFNLPPPYASTPSLVQGSSGLSVSFVAGLEKRGNCQDSLFQLHDRTLTEHEGALLSRDTKLLSLDHQELLNPTLGSGKKVIDLTLSSNLVTFVGDVPNILNSTSAICAYDRFPVGVSRDIYPVELKGVANSEVVEDVTRRITAVHTMNNSSNDSKGAMGMLKTNANLKFPTDNKSNDCVNSSSVKHCTHSDTSLSPDLKMMSTNISSVDGQVHSVNSDDNQNQQDLDAFIKNRLHEAVSRQANLERFTDSLLRRVKKLQVKQMDIHITRQLTKLMQYQQKKLQIPLNREQRPRGLHRYSKQGDLRAELLQSENVKNLSTAALVNLVRKLESGSALRQKYFNSSVQRTNDKVETINSMTKLPKDMCSEMERVASTLQTNLKCMEKTVDSDATESSSGGESCDELEGYDEKKSRNVPLNKRSAWKWAVDRAAIASRWTWLQAQVSDLEYRIRQQNELYRQLRASKGPVVLGRPTEVHGDASSRLPCVNPSRLDYSKRDITVDSNQSAFGQKNEIDLSLLLSNVDTKNSMVQNSNNNCHSTQINGYVNPGSSVTASEERNSLDILKVEEKPVLSYEAAEIINDASCTASRTRPLKSFRKRKFLGTAGLYQISKKAAKLSSVHCGCIPPFTPCTMCGGRVNNVHQVDPDAMPVEERLGLLDPSYHPVLSLDQDVAIGLHFESLLKNGDWQRASQKPKSFGASRKKSQMAPTNSDHVHKRSRKLKKNATATLTAKFKKKFGDEKHPKGRNTGGRNTKDSSNAVRMRKRHNLSQISAGFKAFKKRERSLSGSSGSSSKPGSPIPSLPGSEGTSSHFLGLDKDNPRRSSMLQDMMRRRRGESAFDINNIVIPYSMAAATRVERLQYKEILTPKWRLIDEIEEENKEDFTAQNSGDDLNASKEPEEEGVEDISDEMLLIRHNKCEEEEKKRFMSYLQTHWTKRGRSRNLRNDSRADSSGANTPDPLSPFPMELQMEHQDSPLTTPPSTPAPLNLEESYGIRRRTTSLTKRDRSVEDFRSASPEIEEPPVSPWEMRTFPLSDVDLEELSKICSQTPPPSPHVVVVEPPLISEPPVVQIEPGSRPLSPLSSSSASALGEDPNDPEWTVSAIPAEKGPRPGIVIKLAKR